MSFSISIISSVVLARAPPSAASSASSAHLVTLQEHRRLGAPARSPISRVRRRQTSTSCALWNRFLWRSAISDERAALGRPNSRARRRSRARALLRDPRFATGPTRTTAQPQLSAFERADWRERLYCRMRRLVASDAVVRGNGTSTFLIRARLITLV
eukprot:scaffold1763_cov211-Pinguiococcus_pyrenoidosus.AAC.4